MGKRYFCDYCDRSFQDNLHNRKKHLNGLQHLKAKKLWYDMFRDAAAILLDEQNKRPCRKFLLTGQCDFGSSCRFSHLSERGLQELSVQAEEERRAREWPLDVAELPEVRLEDWLEKRAKRLSSTPSSRWTPEVPPISLSSVSAPNPHCFFGSIPRAGAQRARVFLRLYLPELVIQAVGGRARESHRVPVPRGLAASPGAASVPAGTPSWGVAPAAQRPVGLSPSSLPGELMSRPQPREGLLRRTPRLCPTERQKLKPGPLRPACSLPAPSQVQPWS
ncbi:zinc finger matrin-type protein 5 isoform X1 [Budorcas taxicolor]|uniref:zinc finger matrin-type protein 5 isoform X1 n=1 Tax=Budorcas taxicolor TaxID=37181 RepID=UPI0022848B9B|nr:zinc finger matrin-type protein 5 isoform X1 [Budorcas taxicolor]